MHSGGGAGGYVWLITDALGHLGIIATYGAGTLLVAEHRQSQLTPDGPEPGGITSPSRTCPPAAHGMQRRRAHCRRGHRCPHTAPTANVWSDQPLAVEDAGDVMADVPAALDALGHTLYPLFCMSVHEHDAWMAAGNGVWGVETYLERFWMCSDWVAVRDAYAWYAFRIGSHFECLCYAMLIFRTSVCSSEKAP